MDVSIFFIFFCSGEGKGGVRGDREGGGSVFLLKIPGGGGGVSKEGLGGGEGAGRVSAGNLGELGVGLNFFFFGAEMPAKWFSGRGWGQQLCSFQSPVVHWLAWTSSLSYLSCRNPYQTPHSQNVSPLCTETPFFHWKVLRRIPFPKIGSYQKNARSAAIDLQFLLQCSSNLCCCTFGAPDPWGKGHILQGESSTRSLKAPLKVPPEAPLKAPLKAPPKAPLKAPLKVSPPSCTPYCALEGAPLVTLPLALPRMGNDTFSTSPMCITVRLASIRLRFASHCCWENIGGLGSPECSPQKKVWTISSQMGGLHAEIILELSFMASIYIYIYIYTNHYKSSVFGACSECANMSFFCFFFCEGFFVIAPKTL